MRHRLLGVLLAVAALSGCSDFVDVDEKYCDLAGLPYKSPAQIAEFRERAKDKFTTETKYDGTARNKRIVQAAFAVNESSKHYELKTKNPKIYSPGDDQGMAAAMAELKAACAVPEKD